MGSKDYLASSQNIVLIVSKEMQKSLAGKKMHEVKC